jgi:hypothetical protein
MLNGKIRRDMTAEFVIFFSETVHPRHAFARQVVLLQSGFLP